MAVKAGTAKAAASDRKKLFVEAYLRNGRNGTQAAIEAGYSAKGAGVAASRLLKDPNVSSAIANRAEKVLSRTQLSTERWAAEMAAIGHIDPAELYDDAGNLIPIRQLPEHVRRAIASIEPTADGGMKVKLWDKNTALANIGKHLGVFEQDNRQKAEGIKVLIQLVG